MEFRKHFDEAWDGLVNNTPSKAPTGRWIKKKGKPLSEVKEMRMLMMNNIFIPFEIQVQVEKIFTFILVQELKLMRNLMISLM